MSGAATTGAATTGAATSGAVTTALPTSTTLPRGAASGVLVVCSPGGGSLRGSLDLEVPGHDDYSLARYLAAHGHVVVAADLLGTGVEGPDRVPGDAATMAAAGAALAALVDRLRREHPGIHTVVGLGHSLGAAVTVRAQADHASFEGVAVLGYTPEWVSLPAESTVGRGVTDRPDADTLRSRTLERLIEADPALWSGDVIRFPRPDNDNFSFAPDVPGEVRSAFAAHDTAVPRGLALDFGIPAPALAAAAAVECPVLLAFGAIDASTHPEREHRCYPRSPAVTLVTLPRSAHTHHVSADRTLLWDRILDWIASLPATTITGRSTTMSEHPTPELPSTRLTSLGIDLGGPIPPLGSYAGAVVHGDLLYTSGIVGLQAPDWALLYPGRFGDDLSAEDAYASARAAMLSTLANAVGAVGSIDRIARAVKVTGYIQSERSVMGLPGILNGATDLLVELFGADVVPARSAIGVQALPGGASVELECIFALTSDTNR